MLAASANSGLSNPEGPLAAILITFRPTRQYDHRQQSAYGQARRQKVQARIHGRAQILARARYGFSQSQAAQRLGVPLKTLQNWEIARTKPQGFAYSAIV